MNRDKGPIMWKTAWVDGLDGDDNLTLKDFKVLVFKLNFPEIEFTN